MVEILFACAFAGPITGRGLQAAVYGMPFHNSIFRVVWYPTYGPKSLFKFVKKDQLCSIVLMNRK